MRNTEEIEEQPAGQWCNFCETRQNCMATPVQGSEKEALSNCHVTTLSGVEARISLEETARPPLARLSRRTAQVGFS